MARRLSSRAVTLGAMVTVSSVVLAGCASGGSTYTAPYTDTYTGSDQAVIEPEEEVEEEDDVVARCVRRDSEDDGAYVIVDDERCDGTGRHSAYLWYYGGTKIKNRVSKGTTTRPRHSSVVTRSGDQITRSGKISTNGFGNRTSTGS
ncbi:hypothetical protein ACFXJ8_37540 [Nonomuraea sp. NPDC059194]|uniref:hypothetical protein n=1 Tax=Nonomuraea sp. NPDC059194 TaxID=3346764 RepID=UPI0036A865C0